MTKIDLSKQLGIAVIEMLTGAGHQAYVVGGPVRNALLGQPISDLDVATSARPETVLELARSGGLKAIPTGIDHGTVTVVINGEGIEITTFRRDVATDGRRAVVAFSDRIEEDASRRDFTMNALYADSEGKVIDPLGGLSDLYARKVRFIDDPAERIREDYLRILRFFRFYAWYGDPGEGIDADGLAACAELADGLGELSRERIGAEMLKLLSADDPGPALAAMQNSGVLMRVLSGSNAEQLPVLVHLEQEQGVAAEPLRRLVAVGGENPSDALRLSKKQSFDLQTMQKSVSEMKPAHEVGYRLGDRRGIDVVLLKACLFGGQNVEADIERVDAGASAVFPLRASDLPHLTGPDLGKALKQAEQDWIASVFVLSKAELIATTQS